MFPSDRVRSFWAILFLHCFINIVTFYQDDVTISLEWNTETVKEYTTKFKFSWIKSEFIRVAIVTMLDLVEILLLAARVELEVDNPLSVYT